MNRHTENHFELDARWQSGLTLSAMVSESAFHLVSAIERLWRRHRQTD